MMTHNSARAGRHIFWGHYVSDRAALRQLHTSCASGDEYRLARFAGMPCHQRSFKPSCTWREVVAVEVTTPAVGDGPPVAAA